MKIQKYIVKRNSLIVSIADKMNMTLKGSVKKWESRKTNSFFKKILYLNLVKSNFSGYGEWTNICVITIKFALKIYIMYLAIPV